MASKGVPEWLRLQRKIFSRWVSQKLWMSKHIKVEDIVTDLQTDPTILLRLVEVLTDKPFTGKIGKVTKMRVQLIAVANEVLNFIYGSGVQMKIKTSAEDIIDGDEKNVLALVFSILLKFMKIGDDDGGQQLSAKDALLKWVQTKTQGYADVSVVNFTTSFQSGLALCALIHKHRPQLLDYDKVSRTDKVAAVQAAMDGAEKYFGLEKYITPQEFLKLDECGMMVYVSEYFYGIAEQRKIDQAARRIHKVIKFTQTCDGMRAEFQKESATYLERLKKVEEVLGDRSIDNTMAGARRKLEEFYKYKTEDKNVLLGCQLSIESLYNNLSMLLVQNNRPEFVPPAGLSLKDIEAAMTHLEEAEQERKVALHAELNRQIRLLKLDEHHTSAHANLAAYTKEKLAYLAECDKGIESVGKAQFALRTLEAFSKECASIRSLGLADLLKLGAELVAEKYERSADVEAREGAVKADFDEMDRIATEKKPILDDHLARELFKEELRLKGIQHGDRYNKLCAWNAEKEAYLAVREDIASIADAQLNLSLLDVFDSEFKDMHPSSVVPLKKLGEEILTAEYKSEYSSYKYHLADEITSHEADIDEKWAKLTSGAAEKRGYLDECLAREQKKEELRLEFADEAATLVRWSASRCEDLGLSLFGFTLEEVEAYAEPLAASTNEISSTLGEKKSEYEKTWAAMEEMGISENSYTTLGIEELGAACAAVEKALGERQERYETELARQRANDELCKKFAGVADPLGQWVVETKNAITQSKEPLRAQLAFVEKKISEKDTDGAALSEIEKLQEEMDGRGITNNRHTLLTAKDVQVLWEQYGQFLEKKKGMLEAEIEREEMRGLSPEEMAEIEEIFKQYDTDKNSEIDAKEMKACLYALGEEMSQAAVVKIMEEYGTGTSIVYDGFKRFMVHLFGDTDSKEDVLSGWELLSKGNPVVVVDQMASVMQKEDVDYVTKTAPQKDSGYDFKAWTDDVFSR